MPVPEHTQKYRIVECNPERPRRFRRTKTGCITCKIRRIRCDEHKPACNRCVSTGRKCDGYQSNHSTQSTQSTQQRTPGSRGGDTSPPSSPEPLPQVRWITLSRKNAQELQSYRYFLDATAPAIAGVFETDFWLTYIPRACHMDAAIWHAVVALGAVHKVSFSRSVTPLEDSAFALQQMNAAINELVRPRSPSDGREEKWRALTSSVVFSYLYSFQGLHSEAAIHLSAAKAMIQDLHETRQVRSAPNTPMCAKSKGLDGVANSAIDSPIPYHDLFSVVSCLEVAGQILHSSSASDSQNFPIDPTAYDPWAYRAPLPPEGSIVCKHGRCSPSRATPQDLSRTQTAIKALLKDLMAVSQLHAGEIARLALRGDQNALETLVQRQQPHVVAYHELSIAIDTFVLDAFAACGCFGSEAAASPLQRKAVDVLRMYHATCFPLFLCTPENALTSDTYHPILAASESSARGLVYQRRRGRILVQTGPDGFEEQGQCPQFDGTFAKRQRFSTLNFEQALTLAELILHDPISRSRSGNPLDVIPTLPTSTLLLIMANVGVITTELRDQVVQLLRRDPQQEGPLEHVFAAALYDLIQGVGTRDWERQTDAEAASLGAFDCAHMPFTDNRIVG